MPATVTARHHGQRRHGDAEGRAARRHHDHDAVHRSRELAPTSPGLAYDSHTKDLRSDLDEQADRVDLLGRRAREPGAGRPRTEPVLAGGEVRRVHRAARTIDPYTHTDRARRDVVEQRRDAVHRRSAAGEFLRRERSGQDGGKPDACVRQDRRRKRGLGQLAGLELDAPRNRHARPSRRSSSAAHGAASCKAFSVESDGSLLPDPLWRAGAAAGDGDAGRRVARSTCTTRKGGTTGYRAVHLGQPGFQSNGGAGFARRRGLPARRPQQGRSASERHAAHAHRRAGRHRQFHAGLRGCAERAPVRGGDLHRRERIRSFVECAGRPHAGGLCRCERRHAAWRSTRTPARRPTPSCRTRSIINGLRAVQRSCLRASLLRRRRGRRRGHLRYELEQLENDTGRHAGPRRARACSRWMSRIRPT